MNEDQWEELQEELNETLGKILDKYDKGFVNKWVTVIEVVQAEDGDRAFWSVGSTNNRAWDAKGLLQHALDIEQAQTLAFRIRESDE